VTSGPRIARFRQISSVGHVRHIRFGSETLATLPCASRSAERSGQFASARAIEPALSSKTTPSFGIGSVTTTSMSSFLPNSSARPRSAQFDRLATMRTLNISDLERLPVWLKFLCWLAVFFSPTIYGLLLAMVMSLPPPAAAETFVAVMLIVSLVVPPMVLDTIIPPSGFSQQWMMIAGPLTSLGMTVQFGVWVFIIFFPEAGADILKHLKGA